MMTDSEKQKQTAQYNKYLEIQVKTASREKLLMMLIEGATRFAEQGKAQLEANKFDEMNDLFVRAQKIMLELTMSLDKNSVKPEIYNNLTGLYQFVYTRLLQANVKHDVKLADEAIAILKEIHAIWTAAIQQMYKEGMDRMRLIPKSDGASQGFVVEG
jgi:flagellar protein FliS